MSLVLADVQPTENPKITEITVLEEFEGKTNGEVMQAVFPNCYMGIDDDEWIVTNIDGRTMFQPEWWNAPYKAESEVTE